MSKLSDQEHIARAMLLGRVYDWRDSTYCILKEGIPIIDDSEFTALDADTLEPIRSEVSEQRMRHRGTNLKAWDDPSGRYNSWDVYKP